MPVFTDRGEELYPISRDVFNAMFDAGMFGDEQRVHVELLDGAIVPVSPEGLTHARILGDVTAWAVRGVDLERFVVPINAPLAMSPLSQPQPDVMIVDRAVYDGTEHPTRPYLVIEVSHTTLRTDLRRKADIYARGGAPEYWVVDVARRAVHVHRDPRRDVYASVTLVEAPAALEPVGLDLTPLDLAKLFAEG